MTRNQPDNTPAIRRLIAIAVDVLLLVLMSVVVFVALTGGTAFVVRGLSISVKTTGNPIAFGAALACLRYLILPTVPFLGFGLWTPRDLDAAAASLLRWLSGEDNRLRSVAAISIACILAASASLRLINAWAHPGFTTGDDVEIHEMTLGHLFGKSWEIWNLRNPLYPMGVVFPAQALVSSIGYLDVRTLVFAGRLPVVALATATIWLVYRVSLHLASSYAAALLAATLLATSRLHLWYGSSELPRPVASAFVLMAFWILIKYDRAGAAAICGALLGIGGALRFGELVFFAPALVHLAIERRWRGAMFLGVTGALTAALCLGVADWVYWGRPFFSVVNAVDYTLIQRASSRGFQPAWYYVSNAADWTNIIFLALAVTAIFTVDRRLTLWIWLPVLLLSLLPHKEARYVIPVLPFLCIAVAAALANPATLTTRRRKTIAVFGVILAVIFEFSNWRFRRSDEAVALAQHINSLHPLGIAAQQLWRFGGRLYFSEVSGSIIDIREPIEPAEFLRGDVQVVVLLRRFLGPDLLSDLQHRGYIVSEQLSSPEFVTFVRQ